MIDRSNPPDHVDRFAHPAWLFAYPVLLIIVITLELIYGYEIQMYGYSYLWKSLILGVYLGLPANLFSKWCLRRNVNFYAEFVLTECPARLSLVLSNRHMVCCLPSMIAVMALGAIADVEKLWMEPAYMVYTILMLLWYPEQKLIYETAKQKLDQLRAVSV